MQDNDLISRAAAIKEIESIRYSGDFMSILIHLPAVDAAPVVRCKDCRYAHMTYNGECKYCDFWQEDGGDALYLDGDFYCAAGERKDGDDDDADGT